MLLRRKADALRTGIGECFRNGDLGVVGSRDLYYDVVLRRRPGFEHADKIISLMLSTGHSGRVTVIIDPLKYELTCVLRSKLEDEGDEEDEEHSDKCMFVERLGNGWFLQEGFEQSNSKKLQYILRGIQRLQQFKSCMACTTLMMSPHSLCLQCSCEAAPMYDAIFCSICQENTTDQDEVACLPCNHHFHASCYQVDRCPVCRKGCRASSIEVKVCQL